MSSSATDPETPVPLSNRRGTPAFNAAPEVRGPIPFGVDRLALSAPVAGFELDPSAWNTLTVSNPGTPMAAERRGATLKLSDDCSVFVGVQQVVATGLTWGKIEFNPSRAVQGSEPGGHSLAAPSEVRGAAQRAVDVASALLVPAVPDVGAMRVRRLDVARDFVDVARPDFLVRGLGPVHRPWARRNLVHYDPARSGAQTLMVGSGAGVVRLYDKDMETGGKAPGVLRWEAECRRDWCEKYGGVTTLDEVSDESVARLGLNRWEWSQMGTEVEAMEAVVEKVMRSDLSFAEQRGLIGYLTMIATGADVRAATHTHSKYRRVARELGVTVDPGSLGGESPGFRARLDLESGTAVCGVG